MLDDLSLIAALKQCDITHMVWIPDSETGPWEDALEREPSIELVRVCREGEAIVTAAGLMLGGRNPIVSIQCTGFFEAGDAFRNVVHDMKLPLFLLIGVRSHYAHQRGTSHDTCPVFLEPILRAWQLTHTLFTESHTAEHLITEYHEARQRNEAHAILLAE